MFCNFRISAIVLIGMVVEMNAILLNVTLSKETTQSSRHKEGGNPALAVDGNTNQNWYRGSCSHTDHENQPYWEVDLGASYVIAFIKVYNRLNCCSDNLYNVEVNVYTDHVTYARYGYLHGAIGSTYMFYALSPEVVGRWVKISLLDGIGALVMCEVQIMSNITFRRDYVRAIPNVEGTGTVIASIPVVSKTQCVFLCKQDEACHSVNVRQDMMSSTQMECQLLHNVVYSTTSDKNVTFWRMETDL